MYEEHIATLLNEGYSDLKPYAVSNPKPSGKGSRKKYKISYRIQSLDPETGKRVVVKNCSESYISEIEASRRHHHLKGIQSGVEQPTPQNLSSNEKRIEDGAQDHWYFEMKNCAKRHSLELESINLEVLSSILYAPNTRKECLKNGYTKDGVEQICKLKKDNRLKLIKNGKDYWVRFCKEHGVQYWSELQNDDRTSSKYREWLKTQKSESSGRSKGMNLRPSTIKKKLRYVTSYLVPFVNRFKPVTRNFELEMKPLSKKEEINMLAEGEVVWEAKVREPLDEDEIINVFNHLPYFWKAPFAMDHIIGSRWNETIHTRVCEIDMTKRRILRPKYSRFRWDNKNFTVDTKTGVDYRFYIPDELYDILELQLHFRRRWIATHGIQTPFLFFTTEGEKMGHPRLNNAYKKFTKACDTYGIDYKAKDLHSARLTRARTVMEVVNTRISELLPYSQETLKHESPETTKKHYTVTPEGVVAQLHEAMKDSRIGFDIDYLRDLTRLHCDGLEPDPGPEASTGT